MADQPKITLYSEFGRKKIRPEWWHDRKGRIIFLKDAKYIFEDRRPTSEEAANLSWCALCENFGHDEDSCFWHKEPKEDEN